MDDSLSCSLNEWVVRVDGRDCTNTLVRDGCVCVCVGGECVGSEWVCKGEG